MMSSGVVPPKRAGVSIRPLRWWHIEQLLPLEADLFGAERWTAPMFWNELANGHYYVVAVERPAGGGDATDEEVVGYAGLVVVPASASAGGGEAWINNIAVRRDRQRRGIGRSLLEHLLEVARRSGARQVLLEVAADNGPAQRLYDQYGFDVVDVRKGYYQTSRTDALVLRRVES